MSPALGPGLTSALLDDLSFLADAVRTARGPVGLLIVAIYSFLIAFVLPLPSEIVLAAPLDLGVSDRLELVVIILVSSTGKAAGSLVAFHIGQEAKRSGPIVKALRRSRFSFLEWSERRTAELARRDGYAGLAIALSVPTFPDTISK